jgi:hypothetical protein
MANYGLRWGTKNVLSGTFYSAAVTPVLAMETCPDQNNDQAHEDYINQKLLFLVHPCVPRRVAGLQQRSCRGLPRRECKFPSWSSRRPLVTLAQTELILSLLERAGPHKLFQESTVAGRMARIGANLFRSVRPLLPFIPAGWLGEASRGGVVISVGRLFLLRSKRSDKVKSTVRCRSFDVCLIAAPPRPFLGIVPTAAPTPKIASARQRNGRWQIMCEFPHPCSTQSRLLRSLLVIVDGGREWLTTTL